MAAAGANDDKPGALQGADDLTRLQRGQPPSHSCRHGHAHGTDDDASAAGIPLAVASNSDSAWVEYVLEQLGLLSRFVAITTIDHVEQGKPHPEPFLAACARVGARPDRAVAFEDSATGVASAVAAGLFTVACPGPLTAGHDISAADLVVNSLEDVTLAALETALAGRDGSTTSIGP